MTVKEKSAVIYAVGDIGVIGTLRDLVDQQGPGAPWAQVKDAWADGDLLLGNLEIPFTRSTATAGHRHLPETMVSRPEHGEGLAEAGFGLVGLANNHIMDWGEEGLRTTLEVLERQKIAHAGAGEDLAAARAPAMVEAGGLRLAFLSRASAAHAFAGRHSPGVAPLDLEELKVACQAAREEADAVIVSIHWGINYSDYPSPGDLQIGKSLTLAGATVVVGHHPHVVQGVLHEGKSLIAFSLGDFLFDPRAGYVFAKHASWRRSRTMILRMTLGEEGVQEWSALPVLVDDDVPVPRPAPSDEVQVFQQRLSSLSKVLTDPAKAAVLFKKSVADNTVGHELTVLRSLITRRRVWDLLWVLGRIRPRHFSMLGSALRSKLLRRKGAS